ncbi:hypothetical protein [Halogeometricum borinquense]|uniref:hypothetical protein n=1 Tax=Halogeometricum borinquense TaxID=60847 RepID=UPI0034203032
MDRRTFLRSSASVASVSAFAGCSALGILGSSGPFTVTIDYPGSWGGSVGSPDGQRSVQGSGTEQFEIEGDIVSAVAQKRDAGTGRLTVSIAAGDNVVKRQSTTAQYGTVSVSHRRGSGDDVSGDGGANQQQEQTQNQEQEREQDRQALESLEVEQVQTYVSESEGGIFVTFQVRNPTSDGIGAGAVVELSVSGQDYTYQEQKFLPIEAGTSEELSAFFPEIVQDGPDIGSVDGMSPQGSENAVTCESISEHGYECEAPDYTAHVTFVPEYEVRG